MTQTQSQTQSQTHSQASTQTQAQPQTRTQRAATRRIMDSIGVETRLPVVDLREGDVGVLLAAPLAGVLVGSAVGIGIVTIGLLLAGCTLGIAIVYAAPREVTAWAWLQDVARYVLTRPRVTHSVRPDAERASTEGGIVQYLPVALEEHTQELTGVRQVWPGAHAIERRDGTMEAFLEVDPANMDFAMAGDWEAVQSTAAEFANTDLEFPLTFHTTTRSFPVEELVAQLEERLDDPDVQATPVFGELIAEYRETRPADLADTRQPHYYLGVEVDRLEVDQRYDVEPTPGDRLTTLPVVGSLLAPFVSQRGDLDPAEKRRLQFEQLDARIETVRTELVEDVSGWSCRRLTAAELFLLVTEFWNGTEHSRDDAERLMRHRPALGTEGRGEDE